MLTSIAHQVEPEFLSGPIFNCRLMAEMGAVHRICLTPDDLAQSQRSKLDHGDAARESCPGPRQCEVQNYL